MIFNSAAKANDPDSIGCQQVFVAHRKVIRILRLPESFLRRFKTINLYQMIAEAIILLLVLTLCYVF